MRRYFLILCLMVVLPAGAFAEVSSIHRVTTFNKATDFVSTVGRSAQDKKEILEERRQIRRQARLSAQKRRQSALTRKRMKQQEEAVMRRVRAPYKNK